MGKKKAMVHAIAVYISQEDTIWTHLDISPMSELETQDEAPNAGRCCLIGHRHPSGVDEY